VPEIAAVVAAGVNETIERFVCELGEFGNKKISLYIIMMAFFL